MEPTAGGQGVGVVRAEHPLPVGEQLAVQLKRASRVSALRGVVGDLAAGGQGVGVVDTEPFGLGRQQRPVLGLGLLDELTLVGVDNSEFSADGEGVGMARPESLNVCAQHNVQLCHGLLDG